MKRAASARAWSPEHIRVATASSRVSRRLLDLANCEMVRRDPALVRLLIRLAKDLRRGLKDRSYRDRRRSA
jgi:hypothetical protein